MPVYEYECDNCREKTQRLQKIGEDSSGDRCLTCGDGRLEKVISSFASPHDPECGHNSSRYR